MSQENQIGKSDFGKIALIFSFVFLLIAVTVSAAKFPDLKYSIELSGLAVAVFALVGTFKSLRETRLSNNYQNVIKSNQLWERDLASLQFYKICITLAKDIDIFVDPSKKANPLDYAYYLINNPKIHFEHFAFNKFNAGYCGVVAERMIPICEEIKSQIECGKLPEEIEVQAYVDAMSEVKDLDTALKMEYLIKYDKIKYQAQLFIKYYKEYCIGVDNESKLSRKINESI